LTVTTLLLVLHFLEPKSTGQRRNENPSNSHSVAFFLETILERFFINLSITLYASTNSTQTPPAANSPTNEKEWEENFLATAWKNIM
jgi:hypothetical protein